MPDGFDEILVSLGAVVAEVHGKLVSFGFVDIKKSRLESLFVDPSCVGLGYGKLIANQLLLNAKDAGVEVLALSSSLNAVAFYQSIGFEAQQETLWRHPLGFELASVSMTKAIN
nr:GNAT family N-acetyltransferase [Shewanella sp. KX20019]